MVRHGASVTEVVAKEIEIDPLDALEVEKHVQRVAQSAQFTRAETLKRLLLYLWVHRDEDISEYAVATDALGRPSGLRSENRCFGSDADFSSSPQTQRLL
jgi:hypothetical protein